MAEKGSGKMDTDENSMPAMVTVKEELFDYDIDEVFCIPCLNIFV